MLHDRVDPRVVVSTRPPNWTRPLIETNHSQTTVTLKLVKNGSKQDSIYAPPNALAIC